MDERHNWLWDRNISLKKAVNILHNPQNPHFLSLSSLLLTRKNTPKEVFKVYLKKTDFLHNWNNIKRHMRKDSWNNPRIEFWQAIYEKLKEKYKGRDIFAAKPFKLEKQRDEFCRLIAGKIKSARKEKGLTQNDLAKKLRVSQQVISRIEKGSENISLLTLKKIADGLGAMVYLEIKS